ncbi:hypothetical protein JW905_14160 [bacterium]|nr:hypothetical protein [candidate division CSSED10-310 bacterium]
MFQTANMSPDVIDLLLREVIQLYELRDTGRLGNVAQMAERPAAAKLPEKNAA